MIKKSLLLMTVLGLVVLGSLTNGGCRNAEDYDHLPDISEDGDFAAEEPEVALERQKKLDEIFNSPYPAYTINAGDVYSVKVYDNPELEALEVLVSPDGVMSFMLIGPQKLGGLTLMEATEMIEEKYKKYIKNPKVILVARSIQSSNATILGKMNITGRYPVNSDTRLTDLIANAQGTTTMTSTDQSIELADFTNSVFIRNGEVVPIDFDKAMKTGDPRHNVVMRKNDIVYIAPRADKIISIMGQVNQPQFLIWYDGMSIVEAITKARGLKDNYWKSALVIRGGIANGKVYRVDIDEILEGRRKNVAVKPGDLIYIPKDNMEEYNVYVKKLFPTAQFINLLMTPMAWGMGMVL